MTATTARAAAPLALATPARWLDAPACTVGAALSSNRRDTYTVRRDGDVWSCTCVGNATWDKVCRHIKALEALLPPPPPSPARPFLCAKCAQWRALPGSILCEHCLPAAQVAEPEMAGEIAEQSPEVEAECAAIFAECVADVAAGRGIWAVMETAAERNARARAAHAFEGAGTRIETARDPFAHFGGREVQKEAFL